MTNWDPREEMNAWQYLKFKLGWWVRVYSIPEWVQKASNPPNKMQIPANGSVDAVFTGDSLQYKVVTKRVPRGGAGTGLEQDLYVRIKK